MSEPLVRARLLHQWLVIVAAEAEPWRTRFRDALPADLRDTIGAAGRFDWLPASMHVRLSDVLLEAFGPARAHDYYRRAMSQSVRGPVLGPLFRTGTRLLGLTPAAFLRWASHGWKSSFKDCGMLTGEMIEPGRGRLLYTGLPPVCTQSKAWIESSQGSAYGVYDLTEVQGVVRLETSKLSQGSFSLVLEWTDRASVHRDGPRPGPRGPTVPPPAPPAVLDGEEED